MFCSSVVRVLFIRCSCVVHKLFVRCSSNVRVLFICYSCVVHKLFVCCSSDVRVLFIRCLCVVCELFRPLQCSNTQATPVRATDPQRSNVFLLQDLNIPPNKHTFPHTIHTPFNNCLLCNIHACCQQLFSVQHQQTKHPLLIQHQLLLIQRPKLLVQRPMLLVQRPMLLVQRQTSPIQRQPESQE